MIIIALFHQGSKFLKCWTSSLNLKRILIYLLMFLFSCYISSVWAPLALARVFLICKFKKAVCYICYRYLPAFGNLLNCFVFVYLLSFLLLLFCYTVVSFAVFCCFSLSPSSCCDWCCLQPQNNYRAYATTGPRTHRHPVLTTHWLLLHRYASR